MPNAERRHGERADDSIDKHCSSNILPTPLERARCGNTEEQITARSRAPCTESAPGFVHQVPASTWRARAWSLVLSGGTGGRR